MGKKTSSEEVDPRYLPLGMRVGPWRVTGFGGRGAYGTLYRVERAGREAAGPFALKLAVYPRDPRFEHEAYLLSIIHSPHVPELMAQGVWEHPSGAYPYLVMQWIDGEPLYEWAARRNPSENQVVQLLSQVTQALEATHAVGGLHRFVQAFRRHPTTHYPASTCDDLFALGVMAYRLVTDEYPPSPHPEEPGSEVWREGGMGPRPPRLLNPRMSPELDAFISRLLAVAPEERFYGRARQTAEALEQVAHRTRPLAASPLFEWGYDHNPRVRSPEAVQLTAQREAAARQALERREAEEETRATAALKQTRRSAFAPTWAAAGAVAFLVLVLVLLTVRWPRGEPQAGAPMGALKDRSVSVGDSAMSPAISTAAPEPQNDSVPALTRPLPEKPLPGQREPPCIPRIEQSFGEGAGYTLGA